MSGGKMTLDAAIVDRLREQAAKRANFPSVAEFFSSTPLYSPIVFDQAYVTNLTHRTYQFDEFCVGCGRESVFKSVSVYSGSIPDLSGHSTIFHLEPKCQRDTRHVYHLYFAIEPGYKVTKIGQIPSIASITGSGLRKYRPLLRNGYYEELTKANGLISHGIGIGSFVYLRRIFEKLIDDHRIELETRIGSAIDGFNTLRMDEKIERLKDVLPPALVRNRVTYSILSKGIHALSEEECKLYFPVVKAAILQILEQDFEARERKEKEDALEAEIAKISSQLKKE